MNRPVCAYSNAAQVITRTLRRRERRRRVRALAGGAVYLARAGLVGVAAVALYFGAIALTHN